MPLLIASGLGLTIALTIVLTIVQEFLSLPRALYLLSFNRVDSRLRFDLLFMNIRLIMTVLLIWGQWFSLDLWTGVLRILVYYHIQCVAFIPCFMSQNWTFGPLSFPLLGHFIYSIPLFIQQEFVVSTLSQA